LNKTQRPFSSVSHGSPSSMQRKQLFAVSRPQLNAYGWAWTQLSTDTSCVSSDVLYNLSKSAVCINWRVSSGNGDYNWISEGILKILNAFLSNSYTPDSHTHPPAKWVQKLLHVTSVSRVVTFQLSSTAIQKNASNKGFGTRTRARARTHTHTHTHIYKTDIATRYGLDSQGFKSRRRRDFPHPSRLALEHTKAPVQEVPGLFPRCKKAGALRWLPPSI